MSDKQFAINNLFMPIAPIFGLKSPLRCAFYKIKNAWDDIEWLDYQIEILHFDKGTFITRQFSWVRTIHKCRELLSRSVIIFILFAQYGNVVSAWWLYMRLTSCKCRRILTFTPSFFRDTLRWKHALVFNLIIIRAIPHDILKDNAMRLAYDALKSYTDLRRFCHWQIFDDISTWSRVGAHGHAWAELRLHGQIWDKMAAHLQPQSKSDLRSKCVYCFGE